MNVIVHRYVSELLRDFLLVGLGMSLGAILVGMVINETAGGPGGEVLAGVEVAVRGGLLGMVLVLVGLAVAKRFVRGIGSRPLPYGRGSDGRRSARSLVLPCVLGLLTVVSPAALAQSPIPNLQSASANPQSPIPNPQSAIPLAVQADMDYTARELAKLKRLPIPIYTWPIQRHVMEHPVFGHWLRVTGVCSGGIGAHHGWTDAQWQVCIQGVNRFQDMTLVVNYSPWQPPDKYLQAGETKEHAAETFDIRFLSELLGVLEKFAWIVEQLDGGVKIVVIIDYEGYGVTDGAPLTRKLDTIAYGFWGVWPAATVIWYDQWATPARQDRYAAFKPWLSGVANSGLGYCSLYHGGQFFRHAAIVEATWANAKKHGMTGLVVAHSLGSCWAETPWAVAGQPQRHWDYDCPYNLSADWEMGRRIANEWFAKYPDRYSPWWMVVGIHVWPDPFDITVDPPDFGRHAIALFRGLLGLPLENDSHKRDRAVQGGAE